MDIDAFVNDWIKQAVSYSMDHFSIAWREGEAINRAMANESPYPPTEDIRLAVIEAVSKGNLYPEDPTGAEELRGKIARYCGLSAENVTLGNGSMEILEIAFRLFLGPGSAVVTPVPDYAAFRVRPPLIGARVISAPTHQDLSVSAEALLGAIDHETRLIVFSRPHNPSGSILGREDVVRLLEADLPVLVDEAYIELAGTSESVADMIRGYANLLVSRTFSKGFGLAGFRIGYLLASPEVIRYANRAKPIQNVNLLAQIAAGTALDHLDASLENAERVKETRSWLIRELCGLRGLTPLPSQGNFVTVDSGESGLKSSEIVKALFEKKVFVRDFSRAAGMPPERYFRITVGTRERMRQILDALAEILPRATNRAS